MADNDIYNSKVRYENFKENVEQYTQPISGRRIYQIKNRKNLNHMRRFCLKLDARDISYIRKNRVCRSFLMISHYIDKDLISATRDDIEQLLLHSHQHNKTPISKYCFIRDLKFIWRFLFPEKDKYGREDETIVPYVVRHIKNRIDKSTQKLRKDRLTLEEFDRLLKAFSDDIRMQALISLAHESLGRPQELLGRKIKDVELNDSYAKVTISEHGKEGIGILRSIDSFYYLSKWFNMHPQKDNPEAHLFINLGTRNKYAQLKPTAANILIRRRLIALGINRPVTLYSLKRNGVTFCRLRGDSDVDIQHRARWSSTKQLKTYDLSHQDDSFRLELIKKGLIKADEQNTELSPRTKECTFCHATNGIAEAICHQCKRPLDRKVIEKQAEQNEHQAGQLRGQLEEMKGMMAQLQEREQKRSGYDQVLNQMFTDPEFQQLLKRKAHPKMVRAAPICCGVEKVRT